MVTLTDRTKTAVVDDDRTFLEKAGEAHRPGAYAVELVSGPPAAAALIVRVEYEEV
jgi:hypothetical protein